ncbi:Membrane protein involved in the export of O-antigen and teichoic acid [Flaviramulus basaltis]|uniref:Membrane protein involved in the export of O-antigen and teichoic acid n=1 Tax=Flaviramulus basaltis TaxID=369401 RepID=A0A1K2IJW6_9FLAO|nr:oligosaccharide flippase family protein [Flaviramulus basaltis]SFZ92700.1 Membrane protein involved in the export of O-antigen and teichoic acid [Flaviramulus basaltis]
MGETKESYKQIIKATTLFGGVHFFNIFISVIKSKVVAVLLGTSGIGILTLLNCSLNLLSSATGFGLESSGIKSISEAFGLKDQKKVLKTISVFKRLIFITGFFGCIVTLVFSSYFSQIAFGNKDFTIAFVWLSLAVLFKQLSSGYLSILQSLRELKLFAKANLLANFISLCVVVPMYFYWKINAIAPAILASTIISFLLAFFYSKGHIKNEEIITNKKAFVDGKAMLYLGIMLSFSELFRLVSEYLIQIGISYQGGLDQVGLYGAALVLLNSYVGIVFVVMSKNYYPKLSEIINKKIEVQKLAFHQSYLSILLITPIIIFFIILAPIIVKILFSQKFNPIVQMISWGILGMIFKALSWTLGYIIIAKGDYKVFIKTSICFSLLYLLMLMFGYYVCGLLGVGISFFAYYMIHFFGIKLIVKKQYKIYLNIEVYILFFKCCLLCISTFLLNYLPWPFYKYFSMSLLAIFTCCYMFYMLNKKIPLKELLALFFKKTY